MSVNFRNFFVHVLDKTVKRSVYTRAVSRHVHYLLIIYLMESIQYYETVHNA